MIASFDHCLTAFHAKDGKTPCLKTTDALEQVCICERREQGNALFWLCAAIVALVVVVVVVVSKLITVLGLRGDCWGVVSREILILRGDCYFCCGGGGDCTRAAPGCAV